MADGDLIKMLVKADVNKCVVVTFCNSSARLTPLPPPPRYLEFKQVDGSFVFKGGKVHKVSRAFFFDLFLSP